MAMTLIDIKEQYKDEMDASELEYRNVDRNNTPIPIQADLLERWMISRENYKAFCKDNNLFCD
jgi:hypothetical protein